MNRLGFDESGINLKAEFEKVSRTGYNAHPSFSLIRDEYA
jgi:hypothetical protein